MNGWESVLAKDFCESVRDGTHDTPKPVNQGGKPLVTSKHLKHGRVDLGDTYQISLKDFAKINERSRVDRWDVLMSMIGTVGECALIKEQPDFAIKNLALFKMGGDELRAQWLYYYLTSPLGQGQLRANHMGVSQQFISLTQLRNLEIPLPPLPVQRRIADILSAYDDLIENNRRRIAILEETARLAYRKWFGEEAETQINTVGKVSDFFDITIGRTPPRKNQEYFSTEATDLKWLSIKDMKANRVFALDSAEKLTKAGIEKTRIHISPPGTIFLSFKLTVGVVAIAGDSMATNEAIAHFETDDRALRDYTYCYLSTYQYDKLGSTSAIAQAINSDIVRKMDFVLPARPALDSFEKEVKPMFDQIENLSRQNTALAAARDMLLPRLMKEHIIMP